MSDITDKKAEELTSIERKQIIIERLKEGVPAAQIAAALGVAKQYVYFIKKAYDEKGEEVILANRGRPKSYPLTLEHLAAVQTLLNRHHPSEFGWGSPRFTELQVRDWFEQKFERTITQRQLKVLIRNSGYRPYRDLLYPWVHGPDEPGEFYQSQEEADKAAAAHEAARIARAKAGGYKGAVQSELEKKEHYATAARIPTSPGTSAADEFPFRRKRGRPRKHPLPDAGGTGTAPARNPVPRPAPSAQVVGMDGAEIYGDEDWSIEKLKAIVEQTRKDLLQRSKPSHNPPRGKHSKQKLAPSAPSKKNKRKKNKNKKKKK